MPAILSTVRLHALAEFFALLLEALHHRKLSARAGAWLRLISAFRTAILVAILRATFFAAGLFSRRAVLVTAGLGPWLLDTALIVHRVFRAGTVVFRTPPIVSGACAFRLAVGFRTLLVWRIARRTFGS